jgi:translation initiation factor IF-2
VATTHGARHTELPGWFWTALGCMTVLVVGLTVVFFVFQPSGASPGSGESTPLPAAATTTVVPSAPAPAAEPPRPPVQGMRVQPLAPPPPAIDQMPAPKPRLQVRPVKVARTPAAPKQAAAAKAAAAEASDEAVEEELLKPKQRPAATAQDDEGEER